MRYQNALIISFAFVILCYCAANGGQRVYGYEGRYVLGIGLLLSLISLYKLSGTKIKNWSDLLFLTTLNAVTLAVLFLYVESRALTIALCCAWGIGLFTLPTRTLYKLVLFVIPLIFCILTQFTAKTSLADLSRYDSLAKLFNVAVLDTSNVNTSKAKNLNNEINTTSRKQAVDKSLDLSEVNYGPGDSSRATITSNEVSVTKNVILKKIDGSLGTRYAMLLLGINEIKETWLLGQGNLAETRLVHSKIGKHHPHIHNQYLSYILAGGILHLLIGISLLLASLLTFNERFSIKYCISVLPIASFILLMFGTTSFLEIDGWRNLFIVYSYVMLALAYSTEQQCLFDTQK
jgi:ABC-type multidrug transport system fused ATPase/permease subunit